MNIDNNHQYRIDYKILLDCYDAYEQGQAWTLYLLDNINFPFSAEYIGNSKISLTAKQAINALELVNSEYASDEDLEFFIALVEVEVGDILYEIPLEDLQPLTADKVSRQAIEDWRFYIKQ
ncbi:MAG: hypothetical protein GQ582_03260 [Methyloprofundus sp.]|nr:hypothetical protein [Methyloprofundus sp.]